jgi:hypothetical protein
MQTKARNKLDGPTLHGGDGNGVADQRQFGFTQLRPQLYTYP